MKLKKKSKKKKKVILDKIKKRENRLQSQWQKKNLKKWKPNGKYLLISNNILKSHNNYISLENQFGANKNYISILKKLKNCNHKKENIENLIPVSHYQFVDKNNRWYDKISSKYLMTDEIASFMGIFSSIIQNHILNIDFNKKKKDLNRCKINMSQSIKFKNSDINNYNSSLSSLKLSLNKELNSSQHNKKLIRDLSEWNLGSFFDSWKNHSNNCILSFLNHFKNAKLYSYGMKVLDRNSLPELFSKKKFKKKLPALASQHSGIITNYKNNHWIAKIKTPSSFLFDKSKKNVRFINSITNYRGYTIQPIYLMEFYIDCFIWNIPRAIHMIYTINEIYVYEFYPDEKKITELLIIISAINHRRQRAKKNKKKITFPKKLIEKITNFLLHCVEKSREMLKSEIVLKNEKIPQNSQKFIKI